MMPLLLCQILSFSSLAQAIPNQPATIRGFLYCTLNGDWVVAEEPGLKSCCVGKEQKLERQIFIDSPPDRPVSGKVYTVEGLFVKEPNYDNAGKLQKLYHLQQIRIK